MTDAPQILAELMLDEHRPLESGLRLIEWAAASGASGVIIPAQPRLTQEASDTLAAAAREQRLAWFTQLSDAERRIGHADVSKEVSSGLNAALAGVKVVVKRLSLNRSLGGPTHQGALYPDEFHELACMIRWACETVQYRLQQAIGGHIDPVEHHAPTRSPALEHVPTLLAGRHLKMGSALAQRDLKTVADLRGLSEELAPRVAGAKLLYDCQADDPLTFGMLEPLTAGWSAEPPLDISVVIRSKNEARWIARCLFALTNQRRLPKEIIVVDNDSTDETIAIASRYECTVLRIRDQEFSFGRALNRGIEAATGRWVVSLSAHCIPVHDRWLEAFAGESLDSERSAFIAAAYGRQEPLPDTSDFDKRDLWTTFGAERRVQRGQDFFFHNANSIIRRDVWAHLPFNERLSGVEDRDWAKKALADGYTIVYAPLASVHHYHGIHHGRNEVRAKRVAKVIELIHQRQPAEAKAE